MMYSGYRLYSWIQIAVACHNGETIDAGRTGRVGKGKWKGKGRKKKQERRTLISDAHTTAARTIS